MVTDRVLIFTAHREYLQLDVIGVDNAIEKQVVERKVNSQICNRSIRKDAIIIGVVIIISNIY